ncbi:TIGR01777 family oxidoreductase [Solibacillus sp. FSL H8-0538]|uniref:TIGR01777 family oxidoreductase n=1 Tax=Solibacillus sp. FSL H8-0538 TaxID=2921400 RepID=UPI0030FAE0BC
MKIVISGGSGFVGQKLRELLCDKGHEVLILTRGEETVKDGIRYIRWMDGTNPEESLEGSDAFINLAGVSLNEGRWTVDRKKAIYESRMDTTNEIFRIFENLTKRPTVFINASAIGIYPTSTTNVYTEQSENYATDFLGSVVTDWEVNAARSEKLGIRVCLARFGVILGKESGALPLITLPYQLGVGGTIGSGEQWLSWIHIDDVANAILFTIENEELSGPINFTSPNAKRMKQFGKTVGRALNRPHWLPVPGFALQLALGEKSILVLEGQYVVPEKLLATEYPFKFISLEDAIIDLYNS